MLMDDEKKLMNCVTYSLGEVASQWQRSQMRVLETHLRLVNVLTECMRDLDAACQTADKSSFKYFRSSMAKKVK